MEIRNLNVSGRPVQFVNQSGRWANGYYERSEFFIDGAAWPVGACKEQYYNRSWQRFSYETSMIGAVRDAMEGNRREILAEYKKNAGKNRMTAAEKQAVFDADADDLFYRDVLEAIRNM